MEKYYTCLYHTKYCNVISYLLLYLINLWCKGRYAMGCDNDHNISKMKIECRAYNI